AQPPPPFEFFFPAVASKSHRRHHGPPPATRPDPFEPLPPPLSFPAVPSCCRPLCWPEIAENQPVFVETFGRSFFLDSPPNRTNEIKRAIESAESCVKEFIFG
ncbi:unnamed protein product, partial [Prunus brigantina]